MKKRNRMKKRERSGADELKKRNRMKKRERNGANEMKTRMRLCYLQESPSQFYNTSNFQLVPPGVEEKRASNRSEREARVGRYIDKRNNRLFEKKMRYEVRKVNADKRPKMKGRFVRRS